MKNSMYKITVTQWFQKNPGAKKNYKKTMIEHSLINDAKINAMPLSHRWLFINLLLICGDHANDTVTLTHRQVNDILTTKEGAENALKLLQSLQLVTFEKIDPFRIELKELNRTELKGIKIPARSRPDPASKELNQKIWQAYRDAYLARYKVDPVRNASVNAKISQLGKRLGGEATLVVNFFLTHNDQFYLKGLHAIGLCLSHAEALRTQMLRGKAITSNDVREFEKKDHFQSQMARIQNGEV